jgi:hypothetical protein
VTTDPNLEGETEGTRISGPVVVDCLLRIGAECPKFIRVVVRRDDELHLLQVCSRSAYQRQ